MKQPKNVTPAPDAASAFMREVDEAMHQERLLAIWHRTKWFIVGAIVLFVLAIAGREAWDAWRAHQGRTLAAEWYAYTQLTDDTARAQALPELLRAGNSGTRALAVFAHAGMQHEPVAKAEAYLTLADDSREPRWLRDIARLNAAIALLDGPVDEAKAQLELLVQLQREGETSPAYAPALELLALLAQQNGDIGAAKGYTLKLLQEVNLPADMRLRGLQRLGALGGTAA